MRRQPRSPTFRSSIELRRERNHSMNHIMSRMAEELEGTDGGGSLGGRQPRRRRRGRNERTATDVPRSMSAPNIHLPSSSSSTSVTRRTDESVPSKASSPKTEFNRENDTSYDYRSQLDPSFQLGETVSLNKQRQRVATLMKLCRNQSKLAPVREPIPGLFQKKFHDRQRRAGAVAKLRSGAHAKALKQAQLPPKYQPTRELIVALEEKKDTLPKTINEAMIGADATLRFYAISLAAEKTELPVIRQAVLVAVTSTSTWRLSKAQGKRHIAQQQAGISAMTDGILQKELSCRKDF